MQRIEFALLAVVLLSSLPIRFAAQEDLERLVLMIRCDIDLADDPAFREYMRLRVQAAQGGAAAASLALPSLPETVRCSTSYDTRRS